MDCQIECQIECQQENIVGAVEYGCFDCTKHFFDSATPIQRVRALRAAIEKLRGDYIKFLLTKGVSLEESFNIKRFHWDWEWVNIWSDITDVDLFQHLFDHGLLGILEKNKNFDILCSATASRMSKKIFRCLLKNGVDTSGFLCMIQEEPEPGDEKYLRIVEEFDEMPVKYALDD